jgi:hypothetical protein
MRFEPAPYKPKTKVKKDKTGKKPAKTPTPRRSPRQGRFTKTHRSDSGIKEHFGGRVRKRRTTKKKIKKQFK